MTSLPRFGCVAAGLVALVGAGPAHALECSDPQLRAFPVDGRVPSNVRFTIPIFDDAVGTTYRLRPTGAGAPNVTLTDKGAVSGLGQVAAGAVHAFEVLDALPGGEYVLERVKPDNTARPVQDDCVPDTAACHLLSVVDQRDLGIPDGPTHITNPEVGEDSTETGCLLMNLALVGGAIADDFAGATSVDVLARLDSGASLDGVSLNPETELVGFRIPFPPPSGRALPLSPPSGWTSLRGAVIQLRAVDAAGRTGDWQAPFVAVSAESGSTCGPTNCLGGNYCGCASVLPSHTLLPAGLLAALFLVARRKRH